MNSGNIETLSAGSFQKILLRSGKAVFQPAGLYLVAGYFKKISINNKVMRFTKDD
jgi:hypothetical protein